MENASKALIIAGGILIAIIIISVLVKTYGNISLFQRQQETEEEIARIEEFNKDFTKYQGQYVYGTEVITAINKILNIEEKYPVELKITFKGAYEYTQTAYKFGKKTTRKVKISDGGILEIKNTEDIEKYNALSGDIGTVGDPDADGNVESSSLKNRAFQCTGVEYGSDGRVNKITFVEKQFTSVK